VVVKGVMLPGVLTVSTVGMLVLPQAFNRIKAKQAFKLRLIFLFMRQGVCKKKTIFFLKKKGILRWMEDLLFKKKTAVGSL